jgi:hypothetical protein
MGQQEPGLHTKRGLCLESSCWEALLATCALVATLTACSSRHSAASGTCPVVEAQVVHLSYNASTTTPTGNVLDYPVLATVAVGQYIWVQQDYEPATFPTATSSALQPVCTRDITIPTKLLTGAPATAPAGQTLFVATGPGTPQVTAHARPEDRAAMPGQVSAWVEEMVGRKIRLQGDVFGPADAGRTVRVRGGEQRVTPGPFAEAGQQVSGYNLLECADLDEAIEVATKHPIAKFGSIEIRPFAGN